jgi:hypothetical protein
MLPLRFSLRSFLTGVLLVGIVLGWFGYHLKWARERRAIVARGDVQTAEGSFFLEQPPAPFPLRLFDEHAYRWVTILIVDPDRARSDSELSVDASDPRLSAEERAELDRIASLFPEARAQALFRETTP